MFVPQDGHSDATAARGSGFCVDLIQSVCMIDVIRDDTRTRIEGPATRPHE